MIGRRLPVDDRPLEAWQLGGGWEIWTAPADRQTLGELPVLVQTPASWSNVRRVDDPVWWVSSHLFGRALADYIQLDIIDSCGRCVSLVIRSSVCETSPRARGMMRVINSTKFSEATNPTTSSRCPPSARASRRFVFRTQAAPTAWFTWPGARRLSTSCTPSTRRHRRRRGRILKSRKDDLGNCWEEGYEQTGELRKRMGCDRGHPRGGCESESAGRTDAEDRSTPEETRLDTGRSGEPLRCDAATDQRSAARPGLSLLARRAGQHRDGAGLPRARRSRRCLSRVLP